MLTPMIGQGWLKANKVEGVGSHIWEVIVKMGSPSVLPLGGPVTSDWSTFEPEVCLVFAVQPLDEQRSSVPDASVEPFYFWTHSWNWVYCYYCQPFNSLMIAYWISGSLRRAVALVSPAVNVIGVLQLKQAAVSSHITISSLCSTVLITNHTNIREIWPLPLAIEPNSLQLVYVYPGQ